MSYKDSVTSTITAISKATLDARAELDRIQRARESNHQSLVGRIVGDEGYKQRNAELDSQDEAARSKFSDAVGKAMGDYQAAKADYFTPRPRQVSPETMQFLSLVDLTREEAGRLILDAKNKEQNYTLARMVYTNVQRQGIDMHDDSAAYLERCDKEVSYFADTCASMLQDSSGAYAKAYGEILANVTQEVSDASAAYLGSAGVTSEGVPVEA
ncbi:MULTISPECIES: hypothetical protein [Lancefieldella]|uniref:hypothetical protein n=1 Tax=Lancefieldella TaxID=2767353 RepID=UPI0024A9E6B4|nr:MULTISPECIES: hypothetical protein [Lancefieldella]